MEENIKFFSRKGCGLCNMAKVRARQYDNVEYITLEDDSPEIEEYSIKKVPTVLVDGKQYLTLKDIGDILKKKGINLC